MKGINCLALIVVFLFSAEKVQAKGVEDLALHEGVVTWKALACLAEHDGGRVSDGAQNSPFASMEQTPLQLSADLGMRVKAQTGNAAVGHGEIAKRYGQLALELVRSGSASLAEESIP